VSFSVRLDELRADEGDAQRLVGGKAASLLRLAAAGLPVPRAVVLTSDLFQALRADGPALPASLDGESALAAATDAGAALAAAPWPATFDGELVAALDELGAGSYSVRSSAAIEDRADALGAGIFLSRTDVAPGDVAAAAREVLAAALAPAALAYAARRGLPASDLAMAVLIHPFTRGDAWGTAAFDPAGEAAPVIESAGAPPSSVARARIDAAARSLAARAGGAIEIEWVATGDDVTFLQLRPWRAPTRRAWSHAAALADAQWTWDAAHNPLPLSPAQAGLVALVDARCRTAYRQRVVGGYLFYAPAASAPRPASDAPEAFASLSASVEARLAAPGGSLDDALALFVDAYGPLFGEIQPAARAAREALAAYLREHGRPETLASFLRGVPSAATERARRAAAVAASRDPSERAHAVAAYVERFGDESPVWDVATPTYAEDPGAMARVTASSAPPEAPPPAPLPADGAALLAAARAAAAVGEDDDLLYARVQARVRAALLREGRRLQAANLLARADDVFWLPLELVLGDARGQAPLSLAAVTHAIAQARAAHDAALADPPPLAGARAGWDARAGGVRGRPASSGRAVGPAHLHDPSRPRDLPPNAVLIARTLLPTELPLLTPAAIVVETGGALGHVAAQARERGLPAIVDAAGAATAFREGDRILVDGDAGVAIRVE
jgi:phosphohistidine swiveling domain-containing protein